MAQTHSAVTELIELLRARFGTKIQEKIAAGYSYEHPVSFRVNRIKAGREEVLSALGQAGISCVGTAWYEDAFLAEGVREEALRALPLYAEGKIYLQSLSSMLPPLYLAPQAGESVLDMTAAPGGKTTQLFALSSGRTLITACERDKIRFERLKFNLQRQGATRVSALCADAAALDDFLSFDKILLDAPCTGSGTVTPSSPVRFTQAYLGKCVRTQERLLRKALKLLKKGGTLVYSTCSVLPDENWELLERVLPQAGGALVPVSPFPDLPVLPAPQGTVCVCPSREYEGFFVAKIEKRA